AAAARPGRGTGIAGGRGRAGEDGPDPAEEPIRFDQRGFPRHRAPSGSRSAVRQRMVTTGVLAAVLSAPVVALWAAHRGGDGAHGAAAVASVQVGPPSTGPSGHPSAPDGAGRASGADGTDTAALQLADAPRAETLLPPVQGPAVPVPSRGAGPIGDSVLTPPAPAPAAPGQLTVEAGEYGSRTVITLTDSGGTTIHWHAQVDVDWLRLSRDSGTLEPGQRITVTVTVDETRMPAGHWTARIAFPPSEAVVTLEGGPTHRDGPEPTSGTDTPGPSHSPSAPGAGTDGPSAPAGPSTAPSSTASPDSNGSPAHTGGTGDRSGEPGPSGPAPSDPAAPSSGGPAPTGG
ncbi:hypothetical protein ACFV0G_37495, partial [Kitasatospora sp. NPDC059571]